MKCGKRQRVNSSEKFVAVVDKVLSQLIQPCAHTHTHTHTLCDGSVTVIVLGKFEIDTSFSLLFILHGKSEFASTASMTMLSSYPVIWLKWNEPRWWINFSLTNRKLAKNGLCASCATTVGATNADGDLVKCGQYISYKKKLIRYKRKCNCANYLYNKLHEIQLSWWEWPLEQSIDCAFFDDSFFRLFLFCFVSLAYFLSIIYALCYCFGSSIVFEFVEYRCQSFCFTQCATIRRQSHAIYFRLG